MITASFDFEHWVDNPKAFRPFTINRLNNTEMCRLILTYYVGKKGRALDVTYGVGSFWSKTLEGWEVLAFDQEPPIGELNKGVYPCTKTSWEELCKQELGQFNAIVYDPPYSVAKGGFELNQTEGYKRMARTAAHTDSMKYGTGKLYPYLRDFFSRSLVEGGILVFKNQEMQVVDGFELYDYLIQDNGFQPDGFRLSKPKARPNHAFWMILKKN